MLYGFSVKPSFNYNAEPGKAYFEQIHNAAEKAIALSTISAQQAWYLCEFIDCVDSLAMAATRPFYAKVVESLCEYLSNTASHSEATSLAAKSWAAKTCFELLEESCFVPEVLQLKLA